MLINIYIILLSLILQSVNTVYQLNTTNDNNVDDNDYWIKYAKMASLAYNNKNEILNWKCDNCLPFFTDIKYYSIDDVELFTAVSPENDLWISLRGSDSIDDWINNVNIGLEDTNWQYCNFKLHKGFNKKWNILYPYLNNIISDTLLFKKQDNQTNNQYNPKNNPNYKYNKIYITGHSLGGAYATLLGLNITSNYKDNYNDNYEYNNYFVDKSIDNINNLIITTFGAPRIGDINFVKCIEKYNIRLLRFVNKKDIVPHLPPMILNYRHNIQEIWWDGYTLHNCSIINGEDDKCSNKFPAGTKFEDHAYFMDFKFKVNCNS